jgi:hypothetical protein
LAPVAKCAEDGYHCRCDRPLGRTAARGCAPAEAVPWAVRGVGARPLSSSHGRKVAPNRRRRRRKEWPRDRSTRSRQHRERLRDGCLSGESGLEGLDHGHRETDKRACQTAGATTRLRWGSRAGLPVCAPNTQVQGACIPQPDSSLCHPVGSVGSQRRLDHAGRSRKKVVRRWSPMNSSCLKGAFGKGG